MASTREVVQYLGITRRVLQEYERMGILKKPDKANEYRNYTAEDIARIALARLLSDAGYTLRDIQRRLNVPEFAVSGELQAAQSRLRERQAELDRQLWRLELLLHACEQNREPDPVRLYADFASRRNVLEQLFDEELLYRFLFSENLEENMENPLDLYAACRLIPILNHKTKEETT